MKYFQYTLDDLYKNSARKEFDYITFFAGGGGSSCAYKLAGGDVKYMNEFQQIHVDTYLANFPNTVHECKDIKEVTGKDILEMTGLQKGELDIMDGSPPCPPFSMAGSKREGWNKEKVAYGMKQTNIEDLTWEMIRIAEEVMPKVIVCENVKGLSMDYARDHLNKMIVDFEKIGYSVTWKIMKGHEHGVPQKRERVFIVAVRDDVLDAIGMPFMCLSGLFPDTTEGRTSIAEAIDDLIDDEENIKDAEYLVDSMNEVFNLPYDVPIIFDECGYSNAYYNPNNKIIVFCYELVQDIHEITRTQDIFTPTDSIPKDVVEFVIYHEIGHALIDIYDLPILGLEEDVADQLSVYMMMTKSSVFSTYSLSKAISEISLFSDFISSSFNVC